MLEQPVIVAPVRLMAPEYERPVRDLVQAFTERAVAALRAEGAALAVLALDDENPPLGAPPPAWDGLLLLGGGDVDPSWYGEQSRHPRLWGVNEAVDGLELGLARRALGARIPVFGICRGFQLPNVARGGTLHQHLPEGPVAHRSQAPDAPMTERPVRLKADACLAAVLGFTDGIVRSGHHQGVRTVGRGSVAVAWAEDGLVEAFEDPASGSFGVQWHPEDPAADPQTLQRLARHFVALASAHRPQALPAPRG